MGVAAGVEQETPTGAAGQQPGGPVEQKTAAGATEVDLHTVCRLAEEGLTQA